MSRRFALCLYDSIKEGYFFGKGIIFKRHTSHDKYHVRPNGFVLFTPML